MSEQLQLELRPSAEGSATDQKPAVRTAESAVRTALPIVAPPTDEWDGRLPVPYGVIPYEPTL